MFKLRIDTNGPGFVYSPRETLARILVETASALMRGTGPLQVVPLRDSSGNKVGEAVYKLENPNE